MSDHDKLVCRVGENDLMSLAEHVSRPFPVFTKLAVMLRKIPAVKFVYARWAAWLRADTDNDASAPLDRKLLEDAPVIAADMIEQPVATVELPGDIVIAAPATNDLRESEQPVERRWLEETSGVAPDAVERAVAVAELPVDIVVATPEPNDLSEREQPLERRWLEEAPGIAPDAVEPPPAMVELPADSVVVEPEPDLRSEREQLIRRRWAETGSKMWNPDFNGVGGAALNIQGRVELLPAKPGGNSPRYDKLEFRQVGDQIVCEGVVLDPPKRRR
jgi:hypothetical protein